MTTYTVTSHKLAGHEQGDVVSDDDMAHANVAALIAGGHLTETTTKTSRKAKQESEA